MDAMVRFPRESSPTAVNNATIFPSRYAATDKFSGAPSSISKSSNTSHRISPSTRSFNSCSLRLTIVKSSQFLGGVAPLFIA